MKKNEKHINSGQNNSEHNDFFKKIEISFSETKEDIWNELSDKLDDEVTERSRSAEKPFNIQKSDKDARIIKMSWFRFAVAASLLLLIGAPLFMKNYTNTISAQKGQHLAHVLPDGSQIELNAESQISYQPYWWNFNREIEFKGEAYFKVEKGEKFSVISETGITEVLGTSFNIYARENSYNVFCETGKVRVSTPELNAEFVITPGEMAVINPQNHTGNVKNMEAETILAWKNNQFIFTSQSLKKVIQEIERQYDTEIILDIEPLSDYSYTGYFSKTESIETPLNLICKSFNFKFVKLKNNKYKVLRNKK